MPPPGYVRRAGRGGEAVVRADLAGVPDEVWWGQGIELATAGGRGQVMMIQPRPGLLGVARDYHRGGALAPLLGRRFLSAARAEQELQTLVAAATAGVPTLVPLAALSRRQGAFHELRLVTEVLVGALPLPEFIASEPKLRRDTVLAAGRVVARAFGAGLAHADLHVENLLARRHIDGVEVRVIDLDRARIVVALTELDRDRMLLRIVRHLTKHRSRLAVAATRTDELRFLRGLGQDRGARRATVERLRPRLRRHLARHRILW